MQRRSQVTRKRQPCAHQECQKCILTRFRKVHREPARKNEGKRIMEEYSQQEQLSGAPEDDKVNSIQSRHRQKNYMTTWKVKLETANLFQNNNTTEI